MNATRRALFLTPLASPALAQGEWRPARPLTMIVAFAAGGGTDVAARTVARFMEKDLGQPVVVLNRPGAGGTGFVFQLHPQAYKFLEGHVAKLELLPSDAPYSRPPPPRRSRHPAPAMPSSSPLGRAGRSASSCPFRPGAAWTRSRACCSRACSRR